MKLTKSKLEGIRIHNQYEFAGHGNVYIGYRPADNGRASQCAAWLVFRVGYKTDPEGHWRDYGNKAFNVFSKEQREPQLLAAEAWAEKHYGIKEWAKTPFGFWMDAKVLESRMKELTEAWLNRFTSPSNSPAGQDVPSRSAAPTPARISHTSC